MLQATQAALAAEEPRVARLQTQLKELILSPHDPQLLPTSVVAAIQEYLRYQRGPGGGAPGRGLGASSAIQGWEESSLPLADPQLLNHARTSQRHLSKTAVKGSHLAHALSL